MLGACVFLSFSLLFHRSVFLYVCFDSLQASCSTTWTLSSGNLRDRLETHSIYLQNNRYPFPHYVFFFSSCFLPSIYLPLPARHHCFPNTTEAVRSDSIYFVCFFFCLKDMPSLSLSHSHSLSRASTHAYTPYLSITPSLSFCSTIRSHALPVANIDKRTRHFIGTCTH